MFGKLKVTPTPEAAHTADLPLRILQTSLLLEGVTAPELEEFCSEPVSLAVGLSEFVLLEGLTTREADLLLRLAADVAPTGGGPDLPLGPGSVCSESPGPLSLAGKAGLCLPFQSLLPRLSVLENVTLSQTLTTARSARGWCSRNSALCWSR